ncbi:MAG: hypothetical protein WAP74_04200 [Patescibacteria group bacterium]
MITLFLSYTEFEITTRFWDKYVELRGEETPDEEQSGIQKSCDATLSKLSDATRDVFLKLLDDFELEGTEFQVRIAPDDAKLVSQQ